MLAKSAHSYCLSAQKYYYDQWKSRDLVRLREDMEIFFSYWLRLQEVSCTEVIKSRILT